MAGNLYNSAGGMRYIAANPGAYFSVSDTAFTWATAPAGSAGAAVANFTTLATLDGNNGFFVSGANCGVGFYDRLGTSFRAVWYMQNQIAIFANSNVGNLLQIAASGGLTAAGTITAAGALQALSGTVNTGINGGGGLVIYRQDGGTGQYFQITATSGQLLCYSSANAVNAFQATAAGDFYIAGQSYKPGGGSWVATSDSRLKTAVTPYNASLDAICALRPISYRYNGRAGLPEGRTFYGLAAEDVESVMPEMIGSYLAKLDPDDAADSELLTVDTTPMIFALVNAVRELKARIEALKVA
jgi:Chaperone of endosialidase